MIKKPKLAILLEFGFHEIKKYIHSGFADELSQEFEIVWFAIDKGSKEFHDYFTSTGFPLIYFSEKEFNKPLTTIEKYNQVIRRNWIANKNLGGFHNHSKVRTKSIKTALYGSSIAKSIFEKLALKTVKKEYVSVAMKNKIEEQNVDILFLTGYNSCFSKSFVATGTQMKKGVHYLANSWKDLFINNFVPFQSFSTIFVWSERMVKDFKSHMPYLKKANFVISGNPTFDILTEAQPNQSKQYYENKYGISPNAKWLLYTMMPVGLVMDEFDNIQYISKQILDKYPKEEYVIIVRKNPTHNAYDFSDIILPDNLFVLDHYCTFDKEKDMIVQSPEGEKEWLDLIQYAALNISVPSTVTLEFLALSKPVLNIEFNRENQVDHRLNQFFEAGFYKPLFEKSNVKRCKHINDLIEGIENTHSHIEQSQTDKKKASQLIRQTLVNSIRKS